MGYLTFGLAVAGGLLLVLPWVCSELFGRRAPALPVDAAVPSRLEHLGVILAIRDTLADNPKAVQAIDSILIPAIVARQ